jgi:PrtD family type I secretion system ABC transporter
MTQYGAALPAKAATGGEMKDKLGEFWRSPALKALDRRGLATVAIASLAGNVLMFALPLYSLQVYDRVLTARSGETLVFLTLIVIAALITAAVIDGIRGRLLLRISNAYMVAMGPRVLDAAIAQSAKSSEPATQSLRDLGVVRGFVSSAQGLATLFDAPLVPLFLIVLYLIHPGLGHAMVVAIVALLLLSYATEHLTREPLKKAGEAAMLAQRRADGVMQNAEVVEAMGMRAAMLEYWRTAQNAALVEGSVAADRSGSLSSIAKAVRMLVSMMMIALGGWFAIHEQITTGGMIASSIIATRGLAPLEMLISTWRQMSAARASVNRLNQALAKYTRADNATRLPRPEGQLAVERVVFVPEGAERPVLQGVDFALPAGKWLGLIGPSGAGKTTLAKIMCGIWPARSGVVRLDGADVYTWNRTDFGRYCGYLPQDIELFAGSIRDNIARFGDAEDEAVIEAAKAAGCHELILRLPQGYDTVVGASGAGLSGGQRQRIGLARALFGKPRLLVLDEPNSNLDNEGEQALINAILAARDAGATVIMVSHRPSLLAACDYVAVLSEGRLAQYGPRDEVFNKLKTGAQPLHAVKEA